MKRIVPIVIIVLILLLSGIFYYRYYFVFGDGVKAGTLNQFMHKGYLFKTYEGRLIQTGLKATPGSSV